jgi:hypothetical protein
MGGIDLSAFTWLKHDPAFLAGKGFMGKPVLYKFPDEVGELTKGEHSPARNLFFDFLNGQHDPDDVRKFGQALVHAGGGKAPAGIDTDELAQLEQRLGLRYQSFAVEAARLQEIVAQQGANGVREAMVDMSLGDTEDKGLPAWFDAAKTIAASRSWKLAIAESVKQFGVIETAMTSHGKEPGDKVKQAIDAIGDPYRAFGQREGELRRTIQELVELSKLEPPDPGQVRAKSKEVLQAGQSVGLATEDFAKAIEKAADAVGEFMKEKAKDVYKEHLATVAKDVSDALLATQEATFLATTTIGALAAVFWPLGLVAAGLGIISTVCQKVAVNSFAAKAVEDQDMVMMLLSTSFGGESGEGSEAFEKAEKIFEKIETGMDIEDKLQLGIDTAMNVHEPIKEALEPTMSVVGNVMTPISVTVGSASLMFAFAKGDPEGMRGKWDDQTTNAFKQAVTGCYELTGKRLTPDASPECLIEEFEGGAFSVTLFGMKGKLFPDGRFEPAGHQYALAEAVRLARKAKNDVMVETVPAGQDGREYGKATIEIDFDRLHGDPEWHMNSVSLTVTATVTISLDDFPELEPWEENWTLEVYADYGAVELADDGATHFRSMPYMPLATYHQAAGRNILAEPYTENHPFYRMVTNEEQGLGTTGRLSVRENVRPEDREHVEQWLEGGVRQAFREQWDKQADATSKYR